MPTVPWTTRTLLPRTEVTWEIVTSQLIVESLSFAIAKAVLNPVKFKNCSWADRALSEEGTVAIETMVAPAWLIYVS